MADVARTLTMAGFGAAIVIAAAVLGVYFRRVSWTSRGLLGQKHLHITVLALISVATWAGLAVERGRRFGDPATWETWYWPPIAVAAPAGLFLMWRHERHDTYRTRRESPPPPG